jgi:hypothetical protein
MQELAPACMHLPDTFCRDSLRKLATTPFVQLDEEVLTAIDQAVRALNIDFD